MNCIQKKYESYKLDTDGSYYRSMKSDVSYPIGVGYLRDFVEWFKRCEINNGIYFKGTKLYFTYDNKKYYLSWTFYSHDFINEAIRRLVDLGCTDIAINLGELD